MSNGNRGAADNEAPGGGTFIPYLSFFPRPLPLWPLVFSPVSFAPLFSLWNSFDPGFIPRFFAMTPQTLSLLP